MAHHISARAAHDAPDVPDVPDVPDARAVRAQPRHSARRRRGTARRRRGMVRQIDRRLLERAGWRTTLEFRENHVRLESGQLVAVEPLWLAEAERHGVVISATERSESRAWSQLQCAAAGAAPKIFAADFEVATP